MPSVVSHWSEFRLDLGSAIQNQFLIDFTALIPAPLDDAPLKQVAAQAGVYRLFLGGKSVYVGKADDDVNARLRRHFKVLKSRSNLNVLDITFVAMNMVDVLQASFAEKHLLRVLGKKGERPAWNGRGFGNNDPGRRRDDTLVKVDRFDALHPIKLELVDLSLVSCGSNTKISVEAAFETIAAELPFTFRWDKSASALAHFKNSTVALSPTIGPSLDAHISACLESLGEGWQVTALPGRLICYKELNPERYPSALCYWRVAASGKVEKTIRTPIFAPVTK